MPEIQNSSVGIFTNLSGFPQCSTYREIKDLPISECVAVVVTVLLPQDMINTHNGLFVPSNGAIKIIKLAEKNLEMDRT